MRFFRLGLKLTCALLGLVLISAVILWFLPRDTRPIEGPGSIAEVRQIELGGYLQTVLLRGRDRNNPILLYIHGGPGGAQLPIARLYSDELEEHFVVVHWDQRGAGASCQGVGWSTVTRDQIVSDTIELAEKLGDGRKIFLIGHSWGSLVGALAVQQRPDLFYAYVGTGQLVHRDRQEQLSYDWVVEAARKAGDYKALAELGRYHPPYESQEGYDVQRHWLEEYHGEAVRDDGFKRIRFATYFGREYSLRDRITYKACFAKSLRVMFDDRQDVDLFQQIPSLEVPVFLFTGREDYNTVWTLVEEWSERLEAPHVEMVWFEDAGHLLAIEVPEEFQKRLIEKLLPLAEVDEAGEVP